jgi:general secretion pathway protein J
MMNDTGCRGHDNRGFTLLELMISMAMVAIIVVIVAGAMRLGIQSVERGEKRIDSLERIRTSINIVEAQIQSMTGLTYDDNGEKKRYFKAARNSLQFSTDYSIWGGQRGYTVVSYTIETGNDGKETMKATENIAGMSNGRETPLMGSFDKVYFEYYSKGPTDEKGTWVDEWTDDINIPEKVKLHLVSGQNNFALIIPVRSAASLNEKAAAPGTPGTPGTPVTPGLFKK